MSTGKPILRKIRFKPRKKCETGNIVVGHHETNTAPTQNSTSTSSKRQQITNLISSTNSFKCVICQQKFDAHNLLVSHFRMHGRNEIDLKGRPILETVTKAEVPNKPTSTMELIECEWCPEAFPNISKAIEHKFRKHRYESTNYFCKICGKLFPLNCTLKQHMQIEHNDTMDDIAQTSTSKTIIKDEPTEASFSCRFCNVSFLTESALNFHKKGAHQMEYLAKMIVVPPPSKKIRITKDGIISLYYCHLCGTEYILKYNLRKHLQNYHTEAERNTLPPNGIIKCKACEAFFYSDKAYDIHNRHHTPDDLYVESEEQRQKLVTRVDQDFDIRRVPIGAEQSAQMKMVKDLMRIKQKTKDSNHSSQLCQSKNSESNDEMDEDVKPEILKIKIENPTSSTSTSDKHRITSVHIQDFIKIEKADSL